jgi:glycosyltransferase involved in cell wall biosynthesis
VLVHAECAVTRFHVEQSCGGLYFGSASEFAGVVRYLLEHPTERSKMGQAGFDYVAEKYSWNRVMERFSEILEDLNISAESTCSA